MSHHHHVQRFFTSLEKIYLFCVQARDGGDDVVVIMCANVRYDDRGYAHSEGGNKARKVDRALYEDKANCLRSRDQMLHWVGGWLDC